MTYVIFKQNCDKAAAWKSWLPFNFLSLWGRRRIQSVLTQSRKHKTSQNWQMLLQEPCTHLCLFTLCLCLCICAGVCLGSSLPAGRLSESFSFRRRHFIWWYIIMLKTFSSFVMGWVWNGKKQGIGDNLTFSFGVNRNRHLWKLFGAHYSSGVTECETIDCRI